MTFDNFRRYTQARIGLGNCGAAVPTAAWLAFAHAHAVAKDAVNITWDVASQIDQINALGFEAQALATRVAHREEYLARPDLGRSLHDDSRKLLAATKEPPSDVLILASNGLSSLAVEHHLSKFLALLLLRFQQEQIALTHNRIYLAPNSRVGLIDDVGEIVNPTLGVVIIGERPGLSSPDSLAVYLTYRPRNGRTDAERNCVSNIRPPHGLDYAIAVEKTMFLIKESLRRKLSGVMVKDESSALDKLTNQNFEEEPAN